MKKIFLFISLFLCLQTQAQDLTFSESFEDWDGEEANWWPEGWTVKKTNGLKNAYNSWYVSAQANAQTPQPPHGQYYAEIIYSNYEDQDEWIITPSFTPKEGEELSFQLGTNPFNLLNWDSKYFDWSTKKFKEKLPTADLQVLISVDGGEWQKELSLFEKYCDYDDEDLYRNHRTFEYVRETVSLADYEGQNIHVAFRYVGKEGDSMFLDDIQVAMPPIDVEYSTELACLNWVYSEDFYYPLSYGVRVFPPYSTINYYNETQDSEASYEWCSQSLYGTNEVTSASKSFSLVYKPDYKDGELQPFYLSPTLTASKPGTRTTSFTDDLYPLIMVGGKPEVEGFKFGVSNYRVDDDYRIITEEFDNRQAVVRYGYSPGTDEYWTADFANGHYLAPDEYKHMIAACNYFVKPSKPYIINGGWIHAFGEVDDEAELTIYINELKESGEVIEDRVREVTVKGSDLIREYDDAKGIITIPFHFDEPYIQSKGIILCITGFRDAEHVKYLAFYQTKKQRVGTAIALMEVNYNNDGGLNYSYHHVGHDDDPVGGQCHNNFLFALDAEFPWLESQDGYKLGISADNTNLDVALDSYWDASELELQTLPTWLTATIEGKYDKTVMHLTATDAAKKRTGSFYVAHGDFYQKFSITQQPTSGINDIVVDNQDTKTYNLSGVEVEDTSRPGVYIRNGKRFVVK